MPQPQRWVGASDQQPDDGDGDGEEAGPEVGPAHRRKGQVGLGVGHCRATRTTAVELCYRRYTRMGLGSGPYQRGVMVEAVGGRHPQAAGMIKVPRRDMMSTDVYRTAPREKGKNRKAKG